MVERSCMVWEERRERVSETVVVGCWVRRVRRADMAWMGAGVWG